MSGCCSTARIRIAFEIYGVTFNVVESYHRFVAHQYMTKVMRDNIHIFAPEARFRRQDAICCADAVIVKRKIIR